MRREYFRYGSIFVIITCVFALLISCGSSGGGGEGGGTASIRLSAISESIPADGASSSEITAEVKDAGGNPVAGGTSVTFSTTLGTFFGSDSYTLSTLDDSGIAVASLRAGTTPGFADVTVKSGGVTQLISIEFTYAGTTGVPVGEGFSLSPQYLNISGLWIAGLEDIITAWVFDVNGNAVKDSTSIEFKTYSTGGSLVPNSSATIDGVASSTLTSTLAPVPQQGFVSVTAETTGGPTTRVTSLAVTPSASHIMYAGTNGGGVYKSIDSGASWENISRSSENPKQGQNWIDPYIKGHSAISVDPDDPDTVYAGTGYLGKGNVYRSLNGGITWNSNNVEEWNGLYATSAAVLTVLCDGDDNPATDYPYVWIGTEGRGIIYATDGENFQPSGGIVDPVDPTWEDTGPPPVYFNKDNVGHGYMTKPTLSYTSKDEIWTATCSVPDDATATPPVFKGSGADGWMSDLEALDNAKTEDWKVTYKGTASNVTGPGGKGTVTNIVVKAAVTETWTLKCISVTYDESDPPEVVPGSEIFSVTGSKSGQQDNAEIDKKYTSEPLDFLIISGGTPFAVGNQITFDTTTYWQVAGTVSGVQTKTATTGVYYTSNNREVAFKINEGSVPFAVGDYFEFSTTEASPPYWIVSGDVSGEQWGWARNDVPYTSDNYEVSFTIYEDEKAHFAAGDEFKFSVTANTLGHSRTVWDIVKIPDTHGPTAILYAATATGVFKSANGGQTWDEPGSFTGDFITTLSLHPSSTGADNDIIYAGTLNAGVWVSTNSGAIWTQYPNGMEMGQTAAIKDLLMDPMNDRLYAITLQGPPDDQAVGNVYTHALSADGSMATGQWSEANTGLAEVRLHVMASDDPLDPGALFVGGEGINLYKATGGLTTGAPDWQVSKEELDNRIMARKPILFSGECGLNVSSWEHEGINLFAVYVQDRNGNPPIAGSTFKATYTPEVGDAITYFDIIYGDGYTHQGTFSDPGNLFTNNPYAFHFEALGGELTIEFTSPDTRADDPNVPGCSGADQIWTYHF